MPLDKNKPICPQIEELLCVKIANGELKVGEKLQSVRDMAVSLSVNPNTVQKAFEGLESKGLISSVRGSGWYVGEDIGKAKEAVTEIMNEKTADFLKSADSLGFSKSEIIELIKEWNE